MNAKSAAIEAAKIALNPAGYLIDQIVEATSKKVSKVGYGRQSERFIDEINDSSSLIPTFLSTCSSFYGK